MCVRQALSDKHARCQGGVRQELHAQPIAPHFLCETNTVWQSLCPGFVVKSGKRSSLVSLHCPCPHHRAPLQEDLPRLRTAHLTHSALPGLPCLLEETSWSSRQLSELPGSGEFDVRQIHCLVLSEPWQRRENRRESGGQNQTVHEPCQHCGQVRP